jgi:hypothetical protein
MKLQVEATTLSVHLSTKIINKSFNHETSNVDPINDNSTKQWSSTKIISFNAGKSFIMSKDPLRASWQLPVICLPLVLLLLIVNYSNHGPTLQYS